jgi:O-methyltransferase
MSFYIEKESAVELEEYYPVAVKRLMRTIIKERFEKIALYGFSDNMKWLFRILREQGRRPVLCDWRPEFIGYDCGGEKVVAVDALGNDPQTLVVICPDEIATLKGAIRCLIERKLDRLPTIYDRADPHSPFHQESPFRDIAQKARARAVSMISDEQLFDLIQFIRATRDVPGDVAEYGSLHGGSGAVLVEAVRHYNAGNKVVWLFDTFAGIPKSKWGLDHRWDGSFSNNSYSEVRNAFRDCPNVQVVQGNICDTYQSVPGPISFGYVASDTLETGETLLNFIWPRLSPGGIIAVCDYGSYPHCVPLTVYTDMFFENKEDAIVFHPHRIGIFVMKRR